MICKPDCWKDYAQLAAGNFRKRGMSEIIERAEREMREAGHA